MAGLNDFLTGTTTKATTLPGWYDTAQQNLVNTAQTQAGQVPQLQNTVAGQAINNLSGAQNPFFTAQNQLQTIGANASANPWLVSDTGQVSPNTGTALGAQFAAQEQQLNKILPSLTGPAQAAAIGSGNFGSLRGQTAVDVAKASALADMQQKQMQAYQQAQQTGVQAGTGLSNVGAQGTSTMTTLGQAQQASPLTATADLAQILSSVKAPASVTSSQQMSPLAMIGSIGSLAGGTNSGLSSIIKSLSGGQYSSLADAIGKGLGGLISGGSTPSGSIPIDTDLGGGTVDAASINSFLQQYPEYQSFFADQGAGGSGYNADVQD